MRRGGSNSSAKKNSGDTQDLFAFESSLYDIPVQQAITRLEIDLPLVPSKMDIDYMVDRWACGWP